MSRIRVYELAKELGVQSKEVLAFLHKVGAHVRSASSPLTPELVASVRRDFRPTEPPKVRRQKARTLDVARTSTGFDVTTLAASLFGEDVALRLRRPQRKQRSRSDLSQAQRHSDWVKQSWARHWFTDEERHAWIQDGLRDSDADLAAGYRANGLQPGDLSRIVGGRPGRDWLLGGLSVPALASLMASHRSEE